jgi:hypothetical protein
MYVSYYINKQSPKKPDPPKNCRCFKAISWFPWIPFRVGSIASAAFLVLWIIASTMVSAVFTVRYMGIVEVWLGHWLGMPWDAMGVTDLENL